MLKMTMLKAIREHLLLPGEAMSVTEYKKLTDQDKEELKAEFLKVGVEIVATVEEAAK